MRPIKILVVVGDLLHKAFKDRVSLSYSNLSDNLGMRFA